MEGNSSNHLHQGKAFQKGFKHSIFEKGKEYTWCQTLIDNVGQRWKDKVNNTPKKRIGQDEI